MNLREWYEDLPAGGRRRRIRDLGFDPDYLYQLAYGIEDSRTGRTRQPGIELCRRLIAADARLSLPELRPDVWGEQPKISEQAA
jgi:hypothetical protein